MTAQLCGWAAHRAHCCTPWRIRKFNQRALIQRSPVHTLPRRFARHRLLKFQLAAQQIEAQRPSTAKNAVEAGLKAFQNTDVDEAVQLFKLALSLKPDREEARAAYYNLGCALTKQKNWKEATEAIKTAVNDYDLKLIVAVRDEDLKRLRERREWLEALPSMRGSLTKDAKVDLRAEAKSPYRFPRLLILGSLAAGAALGLLVITGRLVRALQGGEGAPELGETLQNFGINSAAVGVLGFVLWRDLQGKQKDVQVVLREEDLAVLQVELSGDRVVPLLKFRGVARPVLLCGSKAYVERALKASTPYEMDLRARGVSVVCVVLGGSQAEEPDKLQLLREEFRKDAKKAVGFGSSGEAKVPAAAAAASSAASEPSAASASAQEKNPELEVAIRPKDKRFRYQPHDIADWQRWIDAQRELIKLPKDKQNCYIQIQLDGRVRRSGLDIPPWATFVSDLPPLDDIRTSFTDGVISDV